MTRAAVALLALGLVAAGCGTILELEEFAPPPEGQGATDGGPAATVPVPPPPGDGGTPRKRVFVTSGSFEPNFGGLEGADRICRQVAENARLGEGFRAWLSTDDVDARERVMGPGPWYLVGSDDKPAVRRDGSRLIVDHAIANDERGVVRADPKVWTGTDKDGKYAEGGDCSGWTNATASTRSVVGLSTATDEDWTRAMPADCNEPHGLYCFER